MVHRHVSVTFAQVPDLGHETAGAPGLRKSELDCLRLLEGFDFFHLLQHLDFTFHLGGLGVLGAKSINKPLHLIDTTGLVGGLGFQLSDTLFL